MTCTQTKSRFPLFLASTYCFQNVRLFTSLLTFPTSLIEQVVEELAHRVVVDLLGIVRGLRGEFDFEMQMIHDRCSIDESERRVARP